ASAISLVVRASCALWVPLASLTVMLSPSSRCRAISPALRRHSVTSCPARAKSAAPASEPLPAPITVLRMWFSSHCRNRRPCPFCLREPAGGRARNLFLEHNLLMKICKYIILSLWLFDEDVPAYPACLRGGKADEQSSDAPVRRDALRHGA